ncbi:MAG: TIGR03067 domain-containing protein [Parvibaculaceae bacterium]
MTRAFALFLILAAAPPVLAADVVPPKDDLNGTWTAVSAERDGAAAGELLGNHIEFDGDRFRIVKGDNLLFGGRFTTDPDNTPAEIDFSVEDGLAKGQDWAGIYKIENDALTVCDNAPDPSAARPQDFAAPTGSGHVCLSFER